MRVGIIALQHESNTFLPLKTELQAFKAETYVTGPAIREHFLAAHHEVGGMFAGLEAAGITAVPIFVARATPSGIITLDAAAGLVDHMLRELDSAGPIDGLLVAPHGAGVAENEPDFDGYWLSLLRRKIGPYVQMICTLDLHANVSGRMIEACDATIAYRSNPHLDQRDRGIEAASLMARTLRGEVSPTQAACFPPIAINIERQLTDIAPCRELMATIDELRMLPGVLSASALLGFPYADVVEMGSSFIVVTDNDRALAQLLADQIGEYVLTRKDAFKAELISIDDALVEAMRRPGPVCLLDIGDNVGGGSPADGTALASAIDCLARPGGGLHQRSRRGQIGPRCGNRATRRSLGRRKGRFYAGRTRSMRPSESSDFRMGNSKNPRRDMAEKRAMTWARARL